MDDARYTALGLTGNPFPQVPTVNPASHDIRVNGTIFNEEIVADQLTALRQRLERHENLIYAQNTKFVVGVGKSALITSAWRDLRDQAGSSTAYIRCGRKTQAETVDGACSAIVKQWLHNGTLWRAFLGLVEKYARDVPRSRLTEATSASLAASYATMPETVSPRALLVWDVKPLVSDLVDWVEQFSPQTSRDITFLFFTAMFSKPRTLTATYERKARKYEVTSFITIVELLRLGGLSYIYIFLDQFEELFHGRSKKDVHDLASSMRQILEICSGLATFVVTLHPSAAMQLRSADCQSLTTIAPVDDRHVVDLPNITPEQALSLASTYISRFQSDLGASTETLAPFTADCIKSVAAACDGNMRHILRTLYTCVETAVEHQVTVIDKSFFDDNYREITGRVSDADLELN